MTVADINKHGTVFPKGTIIPNPKIITVANEGKCKEILEKIEGGKLKELQLTDKKLPKDTAAPIKNLLTDKNGKQMKDKNGRNKHEVVGWEKYPSALGDTTFTSRIEAYPDVNGGAKRLWIKCVTKVTISNNVLGKMGPFKKGELLEYSVKRMGQGLKNVEDIWISRKNSNLMKKFPPERIKEVAENI